MARFDTFHDPLYGLSRPDALSCAIIDTPAFQRLRRIKQLATASAVYHTANHSRFEHSLGVYHLSGRIMQSMADRGELAGIADDDIRLIRWANLTHDTGHFNCAHVLESLGYPGACHEAAGRRFFVAGDIGEILASTGIPNAGERIADLVAHASTHPLAGLVSGDCDPDKMDYLRRDPFHCGLKLAYEQDRIIEALALVEDPATGQRSVGLNADALPAFEAMLYVKNQLYRRVYYHPVVVSAATMMRAVIVTALDAKLIDMADLQDWTDDEVVAGLRASVSRRRKETEHVRLVDTLLTRLLNRKLYHVAAELPRAQAPHVPHGTALQIERILTDRLGVAPGSILLDVPHKPSMLSTDLLIRMGSGEVRHASTLGPDDDFAITGIRDLLYNAACPVRLYAAEPLTIRTEAFGELLGEAIAQIAVGTSVHAAPRAALVAR